MIVSAFDVAMLLAMLSLFILAFASIYFGLLLLFEWCNQPVLALRLRVQDRRIRNDARDDCITYTFDRSTEYSVKHGGANVKTQML